FVAGLEPDARAVGGVDLVDDDERAVRGAPELVFRVDEDQPPLGADRLASCEEGVHELGRFIEGSLVDDAALEERRARDALVMAPLLGFGARRQDGLGQGLVLREPFRQAMAAKLPLTAGVMRPD